MRESNYNVWVDVDGDHYVHNGVSGTISLVTAEQKAGLDSFLAAGLLRADLEPLVAKLVERRALITDDVDELAVLEKRYRSSQYDPRHMALTVITSLGCNFDCPYCFESKHPSLLKPEVHRAIVGLVERAAPRLHRLQIGWLGGEPLMGRHQLYALSEELIAICDRPVPPTRRTSRRTVGTSTPRRVPISCAAG